MERTSPSHKFPPLFFGKIQAPEREKSLFFFSIPFLNLFPASWKKIFFGWPGPGVAWFFFFFFFFFFLFCFFFFFCLLFFLFFIFFLFFCCFFLVFLFFFFVFSSFFYFFFFFFFFFLFFLFSVFWPLPPLGGAVSPGPPRSPPTLLSAPPAFGARPRWPRGEIVWGKFFFPGPAGFFFFYILNFFARGIVLNGSPQIPEKNLFFEIRVEAWGFL